MDILYFIQVVGAVIVGNFFSAMFVYAAYLISRHEKREGTTDGLPVWVFVLALIPLGVSATAVLLMPS